MSINYSSMANFLREELQRFLLSVQHAADEATRQAATDRLQTALRRVEVYSYAPEEDEWHALSESQRWGYLRLESYFGAALHELRQSQHTVRRVQHNQVTGEGKRAYSWQTSSLR
ncbi:MAG TPA: hypothetical protein VNN62_04730 [Methylomirabilota bacterium]|nr:hypothetical protein [Methylomirabilota bacterium]